MEPATPSYLAMQFNVPTAFHKRTRKLARYIVIVAPERTRALRI